MNYRFLWVGFQLDAICAEISDYGINKALERVPEDMDATYERILNIISAKPRPQRELARRVLIWTTYARRLLSINELAHAISIEMDMKGLEDFESSIPTKESILDACANLISIDKSKNQLVQFVHFSVQEFLTRHHSIMTTTLDMGYEVGHREIAQTCMIFQTLFPKQRNFQDLRYQYVLNQWPHHLLAANLSSLLVDDQIVALTLSFFEKSPVLFTEQQEKSVLLRKMRVRAYFEFSLPVLAYIFGLPGTYEKQSEEAQPKAVYDSNFGCIKIFNDKLAIHYATAELDSILVAQRLYNLGYGLNYSYSNSKLGMEVPDWLQLSPLYSAQSVQMAKYLLDNGISTMPQNIQDRHFDPLQYFATKRNIEILQLLLDRVVDQDGRYNKALDAARNIEVVQLLLNKGVNVNAQDGEYGNILQGAVYQGSVELIRLLLDKGANANAQGGKDGTALQAAVYRGNVEIIRLLLDRGADANAQGGLYGTALQAAVYKGNEGITRLLLDKGANVNAQGGFYGNALQAAVYKGSIEIIRLLLDRGADINAQGGKYGNALQGAAYTGNVEITRLLLDKGAHVNAQGGMYGNALQAAVYIGNIHVIQLLLDRGADVNTQGGMFGTILQAAAYKGNIEVIQLLLDKGADTHARGGKYGAALDKMLALKPVDAGEKVPGDISLLIELLQNHAPYLMKDLPESEYTDVATDFLNSDRCSLKVFKELLESHGWKGGSQEESSTPNIEPELSKNENEDGIAGGIEDENKNGNKEDENKDKNQDTVGSEIDDGNQATIEDEIEDGYDTGYETSQEEVEHSLGEAPKALGGHMGKLFGCTLLVFLLYTFLELFGVL